MSIKSNNVSIFGIVIIILVLSLVTLYYKDNYENFLTSDINSNQYDTTKYSKYMNHMRTKGSKNINKKKKSRIRKYN